MEVITDQKELTTEGLLYVQVQMTTLLPDTADEVIFSDCSKVPYDIKLSDEVNFKMVNRAGELNKTSKLILNAAANSPTSLP